ncbi:MAG TPA: hypothetical protein VJQ82_10135, partial [Terriglobales bacterium]|nr:hypothetical protein [Terriglobales bacterium]
MPTPGETRSRSRLANRILAHEGVLNRVAGDSAHVAEARTQSRRETHGADFNAELRQASERPPNRRLLTRAAPSSAREEGNCPHRSFPMP